MSINSNTSYTNSLDFGVPLEDVFPEGEIHPSLKELIFKTYKNLAQSCYDVKFVLSRLQGTLQERLKLKQGLAECCEFEEIISPGAPFWVLRHFLGLLPLPLLPQYANDQVYIWRDLCNKCKTALTKHAIRETVSEDLTGVLADELLRLPSENFLLAATIFNFLRMTSVFPKCEPNINKNTVLALVKYFSSSLFIRPFCPGWTTKIDKLYYPVLMYIIIKWPDIREICIRKSKYSFQLSLEEMYPGYHKTSEPPEHLFYLSKHSTNNATQTPHWNIQSDTLVRIVPPSYNDFTHLKDVGCQTDEFTTDNTLMSSKTADINSAARIIFLKKDCCCTYSSNYENSSNIEDIQETQFYIPEVESPTDYGWDIGPLLNSNSTNSPTSYFKDSPNYSYDEYSRFNLVCDTSENNLIFNEPKLCDSTEKKKKGTHNEALKKRISKIVWSYASPNAESPKNDSDVIDVNANQYQTYYNLHRSLNEELKDKVAKLQIREETDLENTSIEHCSLSSSRLNSSEGVCEKKKSAHAPKRFKDKFDFFKTFSTRKNKPSKSASCGRIRSGIKYEKIRPFNSTL